MDPKKIASLDAKSAENAEKVAALEKRVADLTLLVETSKKSYDAIESKYEDQQRQILENLQEFQVSYSNHVNDVATSFAASFEKQSSRLETLEREIEDLFRSVESAHMKQNCGVAGALLSASLYLAMLTLGSQVFQQQVTK